MTAEKAALEAGLYCVFGNPVSHSRSPDIHHAFAAQRGDAVQYEKHEAPLDDFAGAAKRMEIYLKQDFPSFEAFDVRANATDASNASLSDKLERTLAELSDDVRERVLMENAVDLALYETAGHKYPAS